MSTMAFQECFQDFQVVFTSVNVNLLHIIKKY